MGNNPTEKRIIPNDFRTPYTFTSIYSKETHTHVTLVNRLTFNINNIGTVVLKQVLLML